MSEHNPEVEETEEPDIKICPRCNENPRATTKTNHLLPYCRQCSRQYQNDRNKALMIGYRMRPENTKDRPTREEILWAREILRPKSQGRNHGDNICPRCKKDYRAEGKGAAYCVKCRREYQAERRQRLAAQALEYVDTDVREDE